MPHFFSIEEASEALYGLGSDYVICSAPRAPFHVVPRAHTGPETVLCQPVSQTQIARWKIEQARLKAQQKQEEEEREAALKASISEFASTTPSLTG